MAEKEQLQIQIVLDDGQVKTGFIELEKQAAKTSKNMSGKAGGFGSVLDSAKGLSSSLLGTVGAYAAIGTAAALAGKKLLDFAIAGEKATATNIRFTEVARQAGLASEQLSQAIIAQTQGLLDDEDALETATKAIVSLGAEAAKLPEILQASRAISRTLGTDFKQTFDNLSQFLETGNAKLLKQYGIVLDLNKAYDAAAKSIGLTSAELTEQQKQVVRLNLALEELPKKFSAGAESVTPLSDAFNRFLVGSLNQLEKLQQGLANVLSRTFIDNADKSNVATARLSNGFKEASDEVFQLEKQLKTLNEDRLGAKGIDALARYSLSISQTSKELREARENFRLLQVELSGRSDEELFKSLDASRSTKATDQLKLTEDQLKKISQDRKLREQELTGFLVSQEITRRQADLETVNAKEIQNQQITSSQLRLNQQLQILDLQQKQALSNADKLFSEDKKFTQEQRELAFTEVSASFQAQRVQLEQQTANDIKNIQDGIAANGVSGIYSMGEALKYLGTQAKQQLAGAFVNGMQAATSAIARGENGIDALVKSVLGAIGDMAVQFGSLFLLQAAGFAVIPGLQGNSATLAAAGAGLIGLGIVLKALSGGESSTSSSSSGGGVASSPSASTELTPTENLTRQEPQTSVQVVVQGDILDSDDTGSRVVELINRAFDKKGVVINRGAYT
jgi:hypothetical protein